MKAAYDILVVGDYCLDLVFTGLPRFPELGIEIVGTGFAMTPGGAYTPAVVMHRLGLRVGWATDLGNDDFSHFVLERVRAEGLSEDLVVHHKRALRNVTVAASYPEERAFIAYYDPAPAVPAAMKALAVTPARAVYVPGIYAGRLFHAGQALVRLRKMKLIMDGNSPDDLTLDSPAVREAIRSVDLFMPNAREARRLTGQSDLLQAVAALAEICPLVVVKDGANGAYAHTHGRLYHSPPIPVHPLDTTGAGDCFNAGFVTAWLGDRPLEECLRWGNIVGGLSTEGLGGTERVVTREEVEKWMG